MFKHDLRANALLAWKTGSHLASSAGRLLRYYGANATRILSGSRYLSGNNGDNHAKTDTKPISSPAIQTLERLHSELGGQILENKEEAQRLAGQMLHVEAVIKMLDPTFNLRPTINLSHLAFTADDTALHFLSHSFAQLVQQHECRLVGQAQIAAEGQCALALHFVAEHGNGCQIAPQGQLVAGERSPRRDGEIVLAAVAAEAERAVRAAGFVSLDRTTGRATRNAVGITQRIALKAVSASTSVMRNT